MPIDIRMAAAKYYDARRVPFDDISFYIRVLDKWGGYASKADGKGGELVMAFTRAMTHNRRTGQ